MALSPLNLALPLLLHKKKMKGSFSVKGRHALFKPLNFIIHCSTWPEFQVLFLKSQGSVCGDGKWEEKAAWYQHTMIVFLTEAYVY